MRKIIIIISALILTSTVWAQSPQKLSYQAVIRDAANNLITSQVVIQISILQGTPAGTPVYVETQTTTPNANGLVSIAIGEGIPVTGAISDIDWSAGPYYIKTETNIGGGHFIEGTSQLLSVPYALYARASGGHYIGEFFGGGIIVAVTKNAGVEHGLIASLTNLGPDPGSPWGDSVLISPVAGSFTDGQANTLAIIAQLGSTAIAAILCNNYINPDSGTGVYSDWYLPSSSELEQCYNASFAVTQILGKINGFLFDDYWSSTENNDDLKYTAYFKYFHLGIQSPNGHRWHLLRVRAVRKF